MPSIVRNKTRPHCGTVYHSRRSTLAPSVANKGKHRAKLSPTPHRCRTPVSSVVPPTSDCIYYLRQTVTYPRLCQTDCRLPQTVSDRLSPTPDCIRQTVTYPRLYQTDCQCHLPQTVSDRLPPTPQCVRQTVTYPRLCQTDCHLPQTVSDRLSPTPDCVGQTGAHPDCGRHQQRSGLTDTPVHHGAEQVTEWRSGGARAVVQPHQELRTKLIPPLSAQA